MTEERFAQISRWMEEHEGDPQRFEKASDPNGELRVTVEEARCLHRIFRTSVEGEGQPTKAQINQG